MAGHDGLSERERVVVSVSVLGVADMERSEGELRTSSVVAHTDVTLLSLDRSKWNKWITLAPEVKHWLNTHKRVATAVLKKGDAELGHKKPKVIPVEEEKEQLIVAEGQ